MIYISTTLMFTMLFLIFWANTANKTNRWFALFTLSVTLGAIAIGIEDYISDMIYDSAKMQAILQFDFLITTFFYYLFPYTFIMLNLSDTDYGEKLKIKDRRVMHLILLLPVVMMYLVFPYGSPYFSPDKNPYFFVVSLWAVPYIYISDILMVKDYLKETNRRLRKEKFNRCCLLLPPTIFISIACYIMMAFGVRNGLDYCIPGTVVEFMIFMVLLLKNGLFGVRIKLEKYHVGRNFRVLNSGASLFSHAFKNEAIKISMCCINIQQATKIGINDQVLRESIEIIHNASEHVLELTSRIQETLHEFEVVKEPNDVGSLMEQALEHMSTFMKEGNIKIIKDYPSEAKVMCDGVHIREMLHNILKNAMEAMNYNGEIEISIARKKRYLMIDIKDNGPGIPKENLSRVIEPFFTTKNQYKNFGLGLCYCYNVMQKHGGILRLENSPDHGTIVQLEFPI